MIVYQTDRGGYFVAPIEADESPLEPGVWLIPAGCVEIPPPSFGNGQAAKWAGAGWEIVPAPEPPLEDPAHEAPPHEPRPMIAAMADLAVNGDEISGVELAVGIGFAMALTPNVFWLFFSEPQPDLSFISFAQARGSSGVLVAADVTDATTDFVEITVTDRTTGGPATPARLALSVQRIR